MGEFDEREGVRRSTAPAAVSSGSKEAANAVQTPPPDSAGSFDSEAPTLLDPSGAFDAATVIEIPAPHEAPTVLEAPIVRPVSRPVSAPQSARSNWNAPLLLPTGTVLANRYEILQLLGEGGMGAVYKARDTELDRVIALKVIRPELASNPDILQRFKQELVLARQVTDRNIIRIFDLGEADGIRFITMEYVEGTSLYQILREQGKLPVKESAEIIEQVLIGLKAAHREGVIHRDLKPGNIMRDKQGRILVMDFGLARSLESDGMTKTGAVLGTMEYMSPEQAMGSELDPRSDLFTVGLIFFELLTGKMPFKAETALASLLKRVQERAAPLSSVDNAIPVTLEKIVAKCLERDQSLRYQTAQDIINDLDAFLGKTPAASSVFAAPPIPVSANKKKLFAIAAAAVAVLFIAVAMTYWLRGRSANTTPHAQVSLLVGDFDNQTSDAVFDGTLEPAFTLSLEGASFISSYSRSQAHTVGQQLKPGATMLDEALARLVAVREGLGVVVTGSVSRTGKGFKVESKAVDAVTGKTIASTAAEADNKQDVLHAVDKLAARIRTALGDTTPESVQLAKAETYSSGSLEAAHEYAVAQELQHAGKDDDSIVHYTRAIQIDPDMGRAYAGLAAVNANLVRTAESEKYYDLAMARIDRMTEREKYRTRGSYYLFKREPRKAIDEFAALVKQFPFDDAGHNNLAMAYMLMHDAPRALEESQGIVNLSHNKLARLNLAIYSIYGGDFQNAAKEAQAIIDSSGEDVDMYWVIASAQLAQGQTQQAADTYRKMEKVNALGASMAAIGLADVGLYQSSPADAIPALEKGITADLAAKDQASAAIKLTALASANLLAGNKSQALSAADRAVAANKSESTLFLAGRTYIEAGQLAKALALASQMQSQLGPEPQLYGKLLEGEARLSQGDAKQAINLFQAAQNIADSWFGRFDLGRAYLLAGLNTEADSEFENCLKRRGEAAAIFLDDVPTYRFLPQVYYYMGRAQEALKSPAAKDSYRNFISIEEKGTGPLLADARKRLASN